MPLVTANGTLIKTWGKHEASLVLGKGHTFTQELHVADVTDSILGANFFASNWLDIDMSNKCPISLDDLNVVVTGVASVCPPSVVFMPPHSLLRCHNRQVS